MDTMLKKSMIIIDHAIWNKGFQFKNFLILLLLEANLKIFPG